MVALFYDLFRVDQTCMSNVAENSCWISILNRFRSQSFGPSSLKKPFQCVNVLDRNHATRVVTDTDVNLFNGKCIGSEDPTILPELFRGSGTLIN